MPDEETRRAKMVYLSVQDILNVANEVGHVSDSPIRVLGDRGKEGRGKIEGAIVAIEAEYFVPNKYPELLDKAGALIYFLVKDHALFDGNKRTSLMSGILFLRLNGLSIEVEEEFARRVVRAAASEGAEEEIIELTSWMKGKYGHQAQEHGPELPKEETIKILAEEWKEVLIKLRDEVFLAQKGESNGKERKGENGKENNQESMDQGSQEQTDRSDDRGLQGAPDESEEQIREKMRQS